MIFEFHFDLCFNQRHAILWTKPLTACHTIQIVKTLKENDSESTVGKGEKAGTQHFLLSHNAFYNAFPNTN